jgi:ribonuclease HI
MTDYDISLLSQFCDFAELSSTKIDDFLHHKTKIFSKNITLIYTDGSCRGNGMKNAKGGIGVFFADDDPRNVSMKLSDAMDVIFPGIIPGSSTNNKAELLAIFFAIKAVLPELESGKKVIIKTDSSYSIDALTRWWKSWEKNKWMTSKKTPVLNSDLIKSIIVFVKKYPNLTFVHVRAHLSKPENPLEQPDWYGNSEADKLATLASNKCV